MNTILFMQQEEARSATQRYQNDARQASVARSLQALERLLLSNYGASWAMCDHDPLVRRAKQELERAISKRIDALFCENPKEFGAEKCWKLCRGHFPNQARKYFDIWQREHLSEQD